MYILLRPLLFLLDAETAHHIGLSFVKLIGVLHRWRIWRRPAFAMESDLQTETPFGIVDSPLGLAAGFDKNAEALWGWQALGFGFVEIGTVTPLPQPGNDRPRIFRLPYLTAIVNRLGFNNDGAMKVAENIRKARAQGLTIKIGGNIGKNLATPLERAANDYKKATLFLHPHVDYLVINVSSPNTPGLRDMQNEHLLEKIVEAVRRETPEKPLFIKIAPDQAEKYVEGIMNVVLKYQISGIICGNTLLNHATCEKLTEFDVIKLPQGGMSGAPLFDINFNLNQIYLANPSRPFLVGVGGITTAERALQYMDAGCGLIQIYTGLVYRGPSFIKKILKSILDSRKN